MKIVRGMLLALLFVMTMDAFAIEGCKWCRKVEEWQPIYCRETYGGPNGTVGTCSPTYTSASSCSGLPATQCQSWLEWAPAEVGDKCETIGGTQDASSFTFGDHTTSSMTAWLNQRLGLPPGYTGGNFSPYTWTTEGTTGCSGGYTTQTWTTSYSGYEASYQVKVWTCNPSGNWCDKEVTVTP